jgi:hypothetical protein
MRLSWRRLAMSACQSPCLRAVYTTPHHFQVIGRLGVIFTPTLFDQAIDHVSAVE